MTMALRIILTTGGTGGHIFPALAFAEAVRKARPHAELLFVGGLYGPEADLAAKAGLPFKALPVKGLLGRGVKNALPALWSVLQSVRLAHKIINEFKPNLVIGFGGYAAFATVFAATQKRIPTALHEQNAFAGLSNRILGKRVDKVFLSLPLAPNKDGKDFFPKEKCLLTGNPIREGIQPTANRENLAPFLLVMGGSQGARAINTLMLMLIPHLQKAGIPFLHQCGKTDYPRMREAYTNLGMSAAQQELCLTPFIENVPLSLATSALALCRAGATTLAELCAAGLPSVLIPFPSATHDHQTKNAQALQQSGAALLITEHELAAENAPDFPTTLVELMQNAEKLTAMSNAALGLAKPEAATTLAQEAIRLAEKGKQA